MNRSLLLALLFWLPAASAFVQGPPAHSVRRCTNRHATHDDDAPAAAPATPRRKRDVLFFWRRAAKVLTNDHSGGLTRAQQLRVSELEAKVASLEVELEKNRAQLEPSIGRDADTPMVLREDEVCLIPNEVMVRVEDAPSNSRRIFCAIDIFASVDEVWSVLTDYAHLGDVVPSLVTNEVVLTRPNGVRLKQVGAAELVPGFSFKARCTLDVVEYKEGIPMELLEGSTGDKSIEDADDLVLASTAAIPLVRGVFPRPYAISHLPHRDLSMQSVEAKGRLGGLLGGGDFALYQGVWRMQPLPNCVRGDGLTAASRLSYAVELRPALPVPVRLLESRIAQDLVANIKAIRVRAEANARARPPEAAKPAQGLASA